MSLLERFQSFYRQLDRSSVVRLGELYSAEVEFIDPVACHQGLTAVQNYFSRLLSQTLECRFEIHTAQFDEQGGFVAWTMYMRHPSLRRGELLSVAGVSELRLRDDKIIYHRDYYDMGEMLYEHLPLLGRVVAALKRRLAA